MNKGLKNKIYIGIIIVICVACGIWYILDYSNTQQIQQRNEADVFPTTIINQTISTQNISLKFQNSWGDSFSIEAQVPETPRVIPVYKGILSDTDLNRQLMYIGPNLSKTKNSTPLKSEAPALAEIALKPYGGLPLDAVLSGVFISEQITQKSSGEITKSEPIATFVGYRKLIDGMPVVGERDHISVVLGENGELLELRKRWRTLEKTGESVRIITPDKAVEKLKHGETYTKLQSPTNARIDDVRLGYYEKPGNIREVTLEPVWVFKSTDNPVFEFPVYARQFAGFSQTPAVITKSVAGKTVQEKDPRSVTFTDTSDARPTKWQWDFGDGTTSSEQNPTHHYKTAGTYNVTLTVWNDMGSDSIVQQYTVTDIPVKTAETTVAVNATITTTIPQKSTLPAGNATVIPTTSVSPTATITVNETVITTATTTITPNVTAPSPVPTDTVSITPTTSLNITPVTTTGNSTAG